MTRKVFVLVIAAMLVMTGLVFASGEQEQEGEVVAQSEVAAAGEAPMLAEMVEAGEIPPLEERIPENPYVVEPWDEIGSYGGTLRRAYTGAGDGTGLVKLGNPGLVGFTPSGTQIEPWLAESFDVSDDGLV